MKKALIILTILGLCLGTAVAKDKSMKLQDVIELAKAKVAAETIIAQIDATDSVFAPINPNDIIKLQKKDVPQKVVDYMIIRSHGDLYSVVMAPKTPVETKKALGGVQVIASGQFKAKSDKELFFAYIITIDGKEIVRRENWTQAYALGNKTTYSYDFETVQFQTESGVHNLEIYIPNANHRIGESESRTNKVYAAQITIPENNWIQLKLDATQDSAGNITFSAL